MRAAGRVGLIRRAARRYSLLTGPAVRHDRLPVALRQLPDQQLHPGRPAVVAAATTSHRHPAGNGYADTPTAATAGDRYACAATATDRYTYAPADGHPSPQSDRYTPADRHTSSYTYANAVTAANGHPTTHSDGHPTAH